MKELLAYWQQPSELTQQTLLNSQTLPKLLSLIASSIIEEQLMQVITELLENTARNAATAALYEQFSAKALETNSLLSQFRAQFPSGPPPAKCPDAALREPISYFYKPKAGSSALRTLQRLSSRSGRHLHSLQRLLQAHNSSNQGYENRHRETRKEFDRELNIFTTFRHPNLVLFIGACLGAELCIVTEFCSGHSLFQLLHEDLQVTLQWWQRLKMALDVAQGMTYLHAVTSPVIHRDLKSLNLLSVTPVLSGLCDFGISRVLNEEDIMTGQMGTCHWMAPEVLDSRPYSLVADVYSFGIVLWEIAARQTPYKRLNQAVIPYHVLKLGERPDMTLIHSTCPEGIKELIEICLRADPAERPSFVQILGSLSKISA